VIQRNSVDWTDSLSTKIWYLAIPTNTANGVKSAPKCGPGSSALEPDHSQEISLEKHTRDGWGGAHQCKSGGAIKCEEERMQA